MSSPPSTLGKYQIIREIARSNDIVYEAYDPLMNRRVALKELAVPGGSTTPQKDERLKRFLREAKAAGSLAHPNIVTIYEVGEDAGRNYLVMEYLDGHTLRNELDTHGFLPPDRAIEVAESILRGLEYAHQNGVIHRDIKPENIQLLSDGRIKLTDFGIARLTFEPNLTMDGQVFGTPSYMSPEQVVGREIDARSDLFSAGVVLYEMLAGQKPFAGDSVVAITYAIMNKEPEQPQQANYALWQVISRALDKSPQMRYANAVEMLNALKAARTASAGVVLDPSPSGLQTMPFVSGSPFLPNTPVPPVIQQPYNPGYSHVPQPPLQYPYNPYSPQPPTQGNLPYQPIPANVPNLQGPSNLPNMALPGSPIPAYYPPPPRKPLLNPEQRQFLGQFIVVFMSVLAILLVAVLVWMYATGQMTQITPSEAARMPVGQTNPTPQVVSDLDGPIDQTSDMSPVEMAGVSSLKMAERMVQKDALGAGDMYGVAAVSFEQAGQEYAATGEAAKQRRALHSAALCHFSRGWIIADGGDRPAARQELYTAEQEVAAGTKLEQDIKNLKEKLL